MEKISGKIGNKPIEIPLGVTVQKEGYALTVSGPKGQLSMTIDPMIDITIETNGAEGKIILKRKKDDKRTKAMHGLTRNLIANMTLGVTEGWSKNLELIGVGFRASGGGDKLVLSVGYSHPVQITAPPGITFEVLENTKIKISGIDKQLVGQVAANIRKVRKPDVYKGKGIRYEGEYVRKKLGKTGKIGATGAGGKAA